MKYIFLVLLYIIAILPFPLIYGIAFIINFILNVVVKYRSEIITANLKQAFPEKSTKEINQIKRNFYRNYTEVFMESIKLLTLSESRLRKMIRFREDVAYEKFYQEDKGAIIITGHRGNFELGGQYLSMVLRHPFYGAYKPFKSKTFEFLWHKIRHNFNMKYIPAKQVSRFLFQHRNEGLYLTFLNDQSPTKGDQHFWINFLNKDAMFFTGPEKLAMKLNLPVYFIDMIRLSRGKYEFQVEEVSANLKNEEKHEISAKYVQLLEKAIRKYPDGWLWSHKRWKHQRKTGKDEKTLKEKR